MKLFRVTDGDCYAVSLVEDPAMESEFIALNKQYPIKLENEKRLLIGAVLIPNKPIYRYMNGQEFYISFDEATIEKLAQGFLANDYQHNITIDHQYDADDIVVVESWIKTSESDKSVAYGLNEPIGTWFISVKVNNEDVWQKIKSGVYKGFSVEAIVGLDEIIKNKVSMDKDLIEKIKEIIYEALGKTPEAEKVVTDTVEDVKEVQEEKEILQSTDENPLVAENEALKAELDTTKAELETIKAENEAMKVEKDELLMKIADYEKQIADMTSEMEAVKAENVKLSKQPSVEPTKTVKTDGKNYAAAVKLMIN